MVNRYKEAIEIQDASNLLGLINNLPEVLTDLDIESEKKFGYRLDSRAVESHPVICLWLLKMAEMTRLLRYKALRRCEGKTNLDDDRGDIAPTQSQYNP